MNQQEIWDNISKFWEKYRVKTPKEIKSFLKGKKGKILDLGCGSGRNFVKQNGLKWYAVDFSEKMLEYARQNAKKKGMNVKFSNAFADNLPFKDNFFDFVIFISTLHCIKGEKNRKKVIGELYRVMKPNAKAIITVWKKEKTKRFSPLEEKKEGYLEWKSDGKSFKRYVYFYEESELKKQIQEVGFKIINFKKNQNFSKHSRKNFVFYIKKS